MKKASILFLQGVIVVLGIVALVFLLWEPHLEGVNAHATTLYEIYFDDPFLAYAYTVSLAFFTVLYQAFKLLNAIARNEVFSQRSVKSLRIIKYCALTLVIAVACSVAYLFIVRPGDDIAGGVVMGLVIITGSAIVATFAAVFERLVQQAVDIQSENELTV